MHKLRPQYFSIKNNNIDTTWMQIRLFPHAGKLCEIIIFLKEIYIIHT